MSIEDEIRAAMEEAMAEVSAPIEWWEVRPGTWANDALPGATMFRLRLGGWRFQLHGGKVSATYGQRSACERDLLIAAQTLQPFEKLR